MKRIVIVGAGASGLMAAYFASEEAECVVFEKNEKAGKKIYITGKGRCNLTNLCEPADFLAKVVDNPRFLYSSLYSFSSEDTIRHFESFGLKTKVERGRRVFPVSDHASDVTKALLRSLESRKVDIRYNEPVKCILISDNRVTGIETASGERILADAVIIATGGMSYPATGSTGDGYEFARRLGHTIKPLYPALTGLKIKETLCGQLSGLTLKNIGIKLLVDKKEVYSDFGELLFTRDGVSGPVILSSSFYVPHEGECELSIDLKSAIGYDELDARLIREFSASPNLSLKNAFCKLLPSHLAELLLSKNGFDGNMQVNSVDKKTRRALVSLLKDMRLHVVSTGGFNEAVITRGGVDVKETDPKTMGSKRVSGLFFAGELLDVAAYTGGYNLQIAWSTGRTAGLGAAGYVRDMI